MSHNAQVINGVEPNAQSQYAGITGRPLIIIGRGQASAYSNSGAPSLADGVNARFYDTSPINTIPNATLNGANDWYQSVSLPAGTYFIRAYFSVLFSATGVVIIGLYNGASNIGSQARVGASATANYDGAGFASTSITLTVTTTISLRLISPTNVASIASQGTVPSTESWFIVEKQV